MLLGGQISTEYIYYYIRDTQGEGGGENRLSVVDDVDIDDDYDDDDKQHVHCGEP